MEYMGLILFFWILGGTGVIALWADRVSQRSSTLNLFRTPSYRIAPESGE